MFLFFNVASKLFSKVLAWAAGRKVITQSPLHQSYAQQYALCHLLPSLTRSICDSKIFIV